MGYREVRRNLNVGERKTLADVLKSWNRQGAKLKRIALNFVNEQKLDPSTHTDFLRELARKWQPIAADPDQTLSAYCTIALKFSLRGEHVYGNDVQLVGRAAAFRSFKSNVQREFKNIGVTVTIDDLDAEIRALVAEFGTSTMTASTRMQSLFSNISLSGMPTWCAFVNPHRNVTPFSPPMNTATAIRNSLGLGCIPAPEEFILLTYDPRHEYILKCPTVADARDYEFFRPAAAGAEHGWTKPLDSGQPDAAPQPEAVHERMNAGAAALVLSMVV